MTTNIIRFRKPWARRSWRLRKAPRLASLSIFVLAGMSIATLGVSILEPAGSRSIIEPLPDALTFVVPASAVRVVDGDTIDIGAERFRLDQWDTPEKFGDEKCAQERRLGEQASRAARQIFRSAESVTVVRGDLDRFGRTVSRWIVDGRDYGGLLYQQGLAQPWAYGHQAKPDWCG